MLDATGRYEGVMLGLAIGDALGWPVEFLPLDDIRANYGPDGITDLEPSQSHPAGTFTDDTQMTLAIGRAILSKGADSEGMFIGEVAREFVAWSRSPENDRAPGSTCMAGCRTLARDPDWSAPGHNNSKGCGTAMRSAPIGLAWHGDEERITRLASQVSELTHGHRTATAGGVATALLITWALDEISPEQMLPRLIQHTRPISEEFVAKVEQVHTVLDKEPESAYAVLGEAWTADEAIACALYAFWRSPRDYRRTVVTAVNMDGDSDSVGCIAGAISGAFNGVDAIPGDWRATIEQADYLVEVARALDDFASAR
ncbi:MAG: ADP-ribosylglycohydrolase family protein [Planctomycetota bacterium]